MKRWNAVVIVMLAVASSTLSGCSHSADSSAPVGPQPTQQQMNAQSAQQMQAEAQMAQQKQAAAQQAPK